MKTFELIDGALDWAVTKCEGHIIRIEDLQYEQFRYSTLWAQGGPIIERERISVYHMNWLNGDQKWMAGEQYGPTPLVAAMRCYVASKLGDEIEIPEGLK